MNTLINKKVVVIGGGTGTFVVLSGLKKWVKDLVAVVSMADSGGSNKKIRDEFGLLPTSDIRQCFVALASGSSETEKIMRQLFTYRFTKGNGLTGMTFGNLFMAALADILGSQFEAIEKTGKVLRINGKVIPVSMENVELCARYENNSVIKGEHVIDEPPIEHDCNQRITNLWVKPRAKASKEALEEIKSADLIILGPGDLYTSTLANLVVDGVGEAICQSRGKLLFILNLMTKSGQTTGFAALDHIDQIKKYTARLPDYVFLNNKLIPDKICEKYWLEEKSVPVKDDLPQKTSYKVFRSDFLSDLIYQKPSADALKRSLVRHDSDKIAKEVVYLIK